MTVPKPTLPAYSPGHTTGYMVSGTDYDNDVLQQGARTQSLIEPVTTFPASPALTDWCFRSDLNALYQCTNATGPVWNQMSIGAFTTAARPAAPPTNYRYMDLTTGNLMRYTGSTYVICGARVKIMEFNAVTDLMSATAITAATWTDICANQSFTVTDAGAPVEIILDLGLIFTSTTATTEGACALLIDGTTRYQISANVVGAASTFAGLAGGSVSIGTLTAAAHTVKVQINTVTASTGYCRASADPTWEFLRLQVFENHP